MKKKRREGKKPCAVCGALVRNRNLSRICIVCYRAWMRTHNLRAPVRPRWWGERMALLTDRCSRGVSLFPIYPLER
jgi:hypothetical protein